MNTEDRELLELAARAAGHDVEIVGSAVWINGDYQSPHSTLPWNPLEHSGEALELAVQLGVKVSASVSGMAARAETENAIYSQPNDGDAVAATRRAIVRAAAGIGRTLP